MGESDSQDPQDSQKRFDQMCDHTGDLLNQLCSNN